LKTAGARFANNVNWNKEETKVTSFKQEIKLIYIESAPVEGVMVLEDM